MNLVVSVILLFNMNVETTFLKTGQNDFQVQAGDLPFDFSSYTNSTDIQTHVKQLAAILTFGTRIDSNATYLNYPLLHGRPAAYCPTNFKCSGMNLHRQYSFDENMITGSTNLSGNNFITLYRLPFYHVIGIRSDPYWPFKNMSLGNCRSYGCGSIAEVVCASTLYSDGI